MPLTNGFVVVSGLPASGKTTLARQLADELNAPLISKDEIKEAMATAIPVKESGGDGGGTDVGGGNSGA